MGDTFAVHGHGVWVMVLGDLRPDFARLRILSLGFPIYAIWKGILSTGLC